MTGGVGLSSRLEGAVTDAERLTEQGSLDGEYEPPGSINWKAEARRWFGTSNGLTPRKVLGYIRRMHRMSVPFYGALCAYHSAKSSPEVDPSFTTCEQLRKSDAVQRFSGDSLSQSKMERDDIARRVQVDAVGMDERQRFGLDMAFACGVKDVDQAMDFATRSADAPSILAAALECDKDRREKVLHLIKANEFGQARALATCGQMSIQLGCPTYGGGCGCEDNYVPVSCDCRLCSECMSRRIGQLVETYTQPALDWSNPVFGTFTIENVTASTAKELERQVDALTGAFGRLRNRTIPFEGAVARDGEGDEEVHKRWCWADDDGDPVDNYWRQDLIRRGHRDRAEQLEEKYVEAEYKRGSSTVRGKNIPFDELVDAGIYAVDIKQNKKDEFNLHLHTVWDGVYIPQPALSKVWEDLTGDPVVDLRRVYGRNGGSVDSAVMEVVAYSVKPPEFETVEDEVRYLKSLKGKRLVQTFGDLHGEVPDAPPTLLCSACESMPAWWDYLGVVSGRIDNMGSVNDGESTGVDPPS